MRSSSSLVSLVAGFSLASAAAVLPAHLSSRNEQKPNETKLHIPGFPVPDPTVAYWQDPPHRIANLRTTPELPTSETFDYVIIGSGISGAGTAHKLLDRNPDLSILMLEARTAASGATGRNGGHCKAGSWKSAKKWIDTYGEDEGLKLGNMEQDCVNDVREFVRSNNVSSDFSDVETADLYYTKEEFEAAIEIVEYQKELEERRPEDVPKNPRTIHKGQEARDLWRWPELVGAVSYVGHTQNPYHTVCAMLELALDKGLNLQTNTMALGLDQVSSDEWHVKTNRGTVKGKQVVLATNAYTNALHPGLAHTHFLAPSRSQVSATHPDKETANNTVFERSNSYSDLHSGNNYIAVRPPGSVGEGDVIIGGSSQLSPTREANITDDSAINEEIAYVLQRVGRSVYGMENWGETTHQVRDWTGITCDTPDGFPVVGDVPGENGLWAIVCMNGHGMAWAYRSAEALVEMMTEGEAPEWFPEPFRAHRAWEVKEDEKDEL